MLAYEPSGGTSLPPTVRTATGEAYHVTCAALASVPELCYPEDPWAL